MNLKNTLIGTSAIGAATLVAALGLQKAYKTFDYYPPKPVFYFASGALAFLAMELLGGHDKLKMLTA
jgi:hypothetical protein